MPRKLLLPYTLALVLFALLLAEVFRPLIASPSYAQGDCRTFSETGKRVCGRFLEYWTGAGGLAQQGLPISNEFVEISELNGQSYTVQYFERAVFEKHPENRAPYDVLLSQLGTFQFNRKYPNGEPGSSPPPVAPTPTAVASSGSPQLQVLDYRVYSLEFGSDYVVGQLKNVGGAEAGSVKVIGTFKDAAGKIVGTYDDSCSCILKPGEIFPFVLYNSSSAPDFTTVEFQLEGKAPSSFERNYWYSDFQASDINAVASSSGRVKVLGKITNTGSSVSGSVSVLVLITDAAGKTLDIGDDYTSVTELAPGASTTFEADLLGTTETPNVRVFGYSTKK